MTCEVTHTIHESGTSLLHVELDDYHSKCLHSLANPPEDWVENIISSRCQPLCCRLWECHIKECCKHDNMEKKTSKAMLILGYEPDPKLIFEPVGKCVDNEDGSCVIEVEIDAVYTKKIQELLPDISQEVKSMICDNVELEAEAILDKVAIRGEHINKTKREIVLEYQREEITEPEVENTPFVDQTAEALQTTDTNLQTTATNLQTTKAELQSEKNKVATMELLVASLVKRVGDLENLVI
jgi:hypothetical protein